MKNNNELLMTEEEFSEAYQKIKQDITNSKRSVDSPVAIVLGGQPGAGKSNIYQNHVKNFRLLPSKEKALNAPTPNHSPCRGGGTRAGFTTNFQAPPPKGEAGRGLFPL